MIYILRLIIKIDIARMFNTSTTYFACVAIHNVCPVCYIITGKNVELIAAHTIISTSAGLQKAFVATPE
jgi:hypothetical protein